MLFNGDFCAMKSTELNLQSTIFNLNTRKVIFITAVLICLLPIVSPPTALLLGLIMAQVIENPYQQITHKATNWLLKISVVGLGFGMNVFSAIKAGREGILFTVASISIVFIAGSLAGRFFKTDKKTSLKTRGEISEAGTEKRPSVAEVRAPQPRQ